MDSYRNRGPDSFKKIEHKQTNVLIMAKLDYN